MSCKRDVEDPWGVALAAGPSSPPTTATATATTDAIDGEGGTGTTDVGGGGSLTSIMAQQEEERRALDQIREMELREEREREKEKKEEQRELARGDDESEEEWQLRLAIEASLRDQGRADGGDGDGGDGDGGVVHVEPTGAAGSTTECAAPAAAAAAASAPSAAENLSAEEVEQIERALREGDEAERAASEAEAASLELAMRLQREEEEDDRRRRGDATSHSSHVRVVHGDDFHALKATKGDDDDDQADNNEDGKRKDYTQYVNYYDDDDGYHDDPDDAALCSGYRINPQTPDGGAWTRTGRSGGDAVTNRSGTDVRTKHDVHLKKMSNAHRLAVIPSGGKGGGGGGVSDNAYNSFHNRMKQRGSKKGVATHGTGRAENPAQSRTRGGALDGAVRLQVQKAINMGILTSMNGAVKEGKEAVVYHADGGGSGDGGNDVAVKVFKRITEFRQRGEYVDGDPRFSRQKFSTLGRRERVELWAEKEYRNLVRAHASGVPTPRPLFQKQNVIFMRFLGEDGWPAPQLKDKDVGIRRGSPRWANLYCQVMVAVRRLYHCAGLVHGDLSEFNILLCPSRQVFGGAGDGAKADAEARVGGGDARADDDDDGDELRVVLIDFGQAVHLGHPSSDELLDRDLNRVNAFFRGRGIRVLSDVDSKAFVLEAARRRRSGSGGDGDGEDDADASGTTGDGSVDVGVSGDGEAGAYTALPSEDAEDFVFVEKECVDAAMMVSKKEASAGGDDSKSSLDSKPLAADALEPKMESTAPSNGGEDVSVPLTASAVETPQQAAAEASGVEGMSGAKWRRAAIGWDEEGDHDRLQELLKE